MRQEISTGQKRFHKVTAFEMGVVDQAVAGRPRQLVALDDCIRVDVGPDGGFGTTVAA